MRVTGGGWRWMVALASLLAGGACSLPSQPFAGTVNGALYEPVGTVFAWSDSITAAPELATRPAARLLIVGTYAYFDAAQDQSGLSGSDLAELKHEIALNDWIVLEWEDRRTVERGVKYTAVIRRDSEDNLYRTQDPSPPAGVAPSAGFAARVRFRRGTLGPLATYQCPSEVPSFLCSPYRPLGSRVTLQVTPQEVSLNERGGITLSITLSVERADGDPADAQVANLSGTLNATVVRELVAESNLDLMDLYTLFDLKP
ncbi:MAG: hypothetical protein AB2A00_10480 [Myxococcota bacterium]